MPEIPVVDAHLHLWDPRMLSYGWHRGNALLDRLYLVEDYQRDCSARNVAAMVFVEAFVDRGSFEAEVRFVEREAQRDPRLRAIVAHAPLEDGADVLPFIEHLKSSTPLLRGIRRIIESEPDLDFCLQPSFIEGVRLLSSLGLTFEMTVNHRHMEHVLRFLDQVSDVPVMLDHCGKPGILEGLLEPWRTQMHALAAHPNVHCKLSGLPTEAGHDHWSEAQIRPYIDAAVDAFGFNRLVFGSDWPVCLQATTPNAWIALLDRAFAGVGTTDLRRFYRDNAVDFYRLELPSTSTPAES